MIIVGAVYKSLGVCRSADGHGTRTRTPASDFFDIEINLIPHLATTSDAGILCHPPLEFSGPSS